MLAVDDLVVQASKEKEQNEISGRDAQSKIISIVFVPGRPSKAGFRTMLNNSRTPVGIDCTVELKSTEGREVGQSHHDYLESNLASINISASQKTARQALEMT